MTSSRPARPCAAAPLVRPPSFSVSFSSARDAWIAGAIPNSTPVTSDTSAVNAATRPSTPTSRRRGMLSGADATSASTPQNASSRPTAPPASAMSTLSVSSCWTIRPRLAPSAVRSAISLRRDAARASSRFATLAHAISSTRPTAPSRTKSARPVSPTISSCSGRTVALKPLR